jgi:Peptidase family M23
MRAALTALFALVAGSAAGAPNLSLPIDCELGVDCHIQQYPDREPGPNFRDYECGTLAYDGHKGTDFSLPTLKVMQEGVNVLAAAPGIVRGSRDSMPDTYYTKDDAEDVKGRECGNGVVVRHEDGWETQYCHMKLGSIRVQKGNRVKQGTILGEVGLSGKTQFPHLHLSVRHNGEVVDPFDTSNTTQCGQAGDSLWDADLPYQPGALIDIGFSPALPKYAEVHAGSAKTNPLPAKSEALVLYGFAYGGQRGDILRLLISGPKGFSLSHDAELDKNQARFFRAYGKRLRQAAWPKGTYHGTVQMIRDGVTLSERSTDMVIE